MLRQYSRAKQGKFSVSSRISSFLLSINELNVELVHKAGNKIPATDFFSRNCIGCGVKRCQICQFVSKEVFVGENAVRQISANDILNGTLSMPYIQPSAWLGLQQKDNKLKLLRKLIANGQQPEPKKTGKENRTLKNLHSLYVKGKLKIAQNGLLTTEYVDENGQVYNPIIVPSTLYPGLVSAIHLKLVHPSKYQMTKLLSRYFLCPRSSRVITDVVDSCHTCLSLKPLPPTLFSETTTVSDDFGSRFSADVMVRNSQHILFVMEKLTGFCFAEILDSETSSNVGNSILSMIGQFVSSKGCTIRTDGASIFQKLRSDSLEDSVWKKLGISFKLGNSLHVNKNPSAENVIKEAHESINKFGSKQTLSKADLIIIVKHINSKIRKHGYSSLELFTKRSSVSGEDVVLTDTKLADKQLASRLSSHNPPQPLIHDFVIGGLVLIKSKKDKLHPRDTYLIQNFITENDATWAEVVKFGTKLVNKLHRVRVEDLVKVPTSSRPTRASAAKAAEKIKSLIPVLQYIQASLTTPTHAWNYEDVLDLLSRGEDEFCVNNDIDNDSVDEEINETTTDHYSTETDDDFLDSEDSVPNETLSNPLLVHNMNSFLNNPSITTRPQVPSQVELDTIQNLDAVFDNIYQQSGSVINPRQPSAQLSAKPKPDYKSMHHGHH